MPPDLERALARLARKGAKLPKEPTACALLSKADHWALLEQLLRAAKARRYECPRCAVPFVTRNLSARPNPALCPYCWREGRKARARAARGG